jgi:hypothetical protein
MPRIISSLTLQANLFQEFQPIGGVRARVLEIVELVWLDCGSAGAIPARRTKKKSALIRIRIFVSEKRSEDETTTVPGNTETVDLRVPRV